MKAKELRIGNWVNNGEQLDYVIDTSSMMDLMNEAQVNEGLTGLKPIPLTEEWLERFGCELIVFDITKGDIGFDFWLTPKWSDYSISVNLEHVHQLQNLYFALTQEELKCS